MNSDPPTFRDIISSNAPSLGDNLNKGAINIQNSRNQGAQEIVEMKSTYYGDLTDNPFYFNSFENNLKTNTLKT